MNILPLTEIFCEVDDFDREFKNNGSSRVLVESAYLNRLMATGRKYFI